MPSTRQEASNTRSSSISGKDLEISKENDRVVIRFAYDKEIELVGPVYLLIKYARPLPVNMTRRRSVTERSPGPRPPLRSELLDALQAPGLHLRRPALLERALTHKQFRRSDHNERLEFLGDSVLNAAVSACCSTASPRSAEGDLTRVRAHLVREDMLHRIALSLDLPAGAAPVRGRSPRRRRPARVDPGRCARSGDRCRLPRCRLRACRGAGRAACSRR